MKTISNLLSYFLRPIDGTRLLGLGGLNLCPAAGLPTAPARSPYATHLMTTGNRPPVIPALFAAPAHAPGGGIKKAAKTLPKQFKETVKGALDNIGCDAGLRKAVLREALFLVAPDIKNDLNKAMQYDETRLIEELAGALKRKQNSVYGLVAELFGTFMPFVGTLSLMIDDLDGADDVIGSLKDELEKDYTDCVECFQREFGFSPYTNFNEWLAANSLKIAFLFRFIRMSSTPEQDIFAMLKQNHLVHRYNYRAVFNAINAFVAGEVLKIEDYPELTSAGSGSS